MLHWELIENTERPLTIIYDKVNGLTPGVSADDGSTGIRIVKDEDDYNKSQPSVIIKLALNGEFKIIRK